MPQLRTKFQNSKLHGIAAKIGLTRDDLHEYAFAVSNGRTEHTSELTVKECDALIQQIEKFLPKENKENQPAQRTIQYHRQKAGVAQIATATHIDHLNNLARGRSMTAEGLGDLSARVNNGVRAPRTSTEVNRVIEAIKAMNRRGNALNPFKKEDKEAA